MPITVEWHNETRTVVEVEFTRPYLKTWDEYHDSLGQARALITSVDYPVGLVVAAYDAPMPPGPAVEHLEQETSQMPANTTIIISIVEGRLYEQAVLNIIRDLTTREIPKVTVASWKAAYRLLKAAGLLDPQATYENGQTPLSG